jgi:hypothetical protein
MIDAVEHPPDVIIAAVFVLDPGYNFVTRMLRLDPVTANSRACGSCMPNATAVIITPWCN